MRLHLLYLMRLLIPRLRFSPSLGSARFLKTVKCRHKRGFLVVKIFVKSDPGISLQAYHRRLKGLLIVISSWGIVTYVFLV